VVERCQEQLQQRAVSPPREAYELLPGPRAIGSAKPPWQRQVTDSGPEPHASRTG
jgi:hypothetical protein